MDVLRQYLISLGWTIDEATWKKYDDALTRTAHRTAFAGAVAIETAYAINELVKTVARENEALYYLSQRTGSSVGSLWAYSFANRQIGVSAEQAQGAVENFATAMRTNPGIAALFGSTGNAEEDQIRMVGRLKRTFGEGGYFAAQRIAALSGIDEKTFRQQWVNYNELLKQREAFNKKQKESGLYTDQANNQFKEYSNTLRDLSSEFDLLQRQMAINFVGPAITVLKLVSDIIAAIRGADKASGCWVGTIGTLAVALIGSIGTLKVLLGLLRMLGLVAAVPAAAAASAAAGTTAATGAAGAGGAALAASRLKLKGGVMGAALMALEAMKEDAESGNELRSYLRELLGIAETEEEKKAPAPWKTKERTGKKPIRLDDRPQERDMLIRTVYGEAAKESETGQAAVAHTILNRLKSGKYGKSVSEVVLKPWQFEPWMTRRQELQNLSPESESYKRIAAVVDKVLAGQVEDPTKGATHFLNEKTVRERRGALPRWAQDMIENETATRIGRHTFGRPEGREIASAEPRAPAAPEPERFAVAPEAAAASRDITINQTNTNSFTVNGAANPADTANRVLGEQRRLNDEIVNLTRNTVGAVR